MARGIWIGDKSIARNVYSINIGVDNVSKRIKNGYIGVSGVARQFFGGLWSLFTSIMNDGSSITLDITSYSSSFESSGHIALRVAAKSSKNSDDVRANVHAILRDTFTEGEHIALQWSGGADPLYVDKTIQFRDLSGNLIEVYEVNPNATSGTWTGTIPPGTDYIQFRLSVGRNEFVDTFFILESLTIGNKSYI